MDGQAFPWKNQKETLLPEGSSLPRGICSVCSSWSSQSHKSLYLCWSWERPEIKLSIKCSSLPFSSFLLSTQSASLLSPWSTTVGPWSSQKITRIWGWTSSTTCHVWDTDRWLKTFFQKMVKCVRTEPKFSRCQDDPRIKAKNSLPVPFPKSQHVQAHCASEHSQASPMTEMTTS